MKSFEADVTSREIELKGRLEEANKAALSFAYLVPGQTWPSELTWLFYAVGLRSQCHAEIGSWCGRSLIPVAAGMQFNSGGKIFAVDNFELTPEHKGNAEWVKSVLEATIRECELLYPDVEIELIDQDSLGAVSRTPALDTCFIDASHHYAEVSADIQIWRTCLKEDGLLCGHDYWEVHPGVMQAVNEFTSAFEVAPKTRIWKEV